VLALATLLAFLVRRPVALVLDEVDRSEERDDFAEDFVELQGIGKLKKREEWTSHIYTAKPDLDVPLFPANLNEIICAHKGCNTKNAVTQILKMWMDWIVEGKKRGWGFSGTVMDWVRITKKRTKEVSKEDPK
jgi:hypothetical protein